MLLKNEILKIFSKSFYFKIEGNVINITGPDAKRYLHSQVTSNINTLEVNNFIHTSLLDNSGKIVSSFLLFCMERDKYKILLEKEELVEVTIQRIEQYHIADDFEVISTDKELAYCLISDEVEEKGCYSGSYITDFSQITFDENRVTDTEEINLEDYRVLELISGLPRFGKHLDAGDLINNTFLDELTVDYNKGCYPGQETVAKIHSRRGAAFKPLSLFIKHDNRNIKAGPITQNEKKVGVIKIVVKTEKGAFCYTQIARSLRIENLELKFQQGSQTFIGTLNHFPLYSLRKIYLAELFYDSAIEFFHCDENEKAIVNFNKAISLNPLFEDAYESLGVLYGRLNEFEKAIKLMLKLKKINKKSMMAYTNLSLFNMKLGNIETAEEFKAEATILNFELLGDKAQRDRAVKEEEEKELLELERREKMFYEVLELDSDDAMANSGLGEILLKKKQIVKAKEHYETAIKSNPKYSIAYLGLAKAKLALKENDIKSFLLKGIEVASKNGDLMPANEMQSLLIKIK